MIGFLKAIVDFLIQPMHIFWILIAIYIISRKKAYRKSERFLYVALIWLAITGSKWLPDLMVNGLEKQYSSYSEDTSDGDENVIIQVLGGGSYYDLDIPAQERLSGTSLARMSEGIRIYHSIPGSKMIFSGFSSTGNVTQAAITKDAAIAMGVSESDISIHEQPETTEEEAIAYKKAVGEINTKLILVTSDIHMPRAMYLFRKHGLDPVAAPSDHILKRQYRKADISMFEGPSAFSVLSGDYWWRSHRSNFDKFNAAMHEYIGLLWAKM